MIPAHILGHRVDKRYVRAYLSIGLVVGHECKQVDILSVEQLAGASHDCSLHPGGQEEIRQLVLPGSLFSADVRYTLTDKSGKEQKDCNATNCIGAEKRRESDRQECGDSDD